MKRLAPQNKFRIFRYKLLTITTLGSGFCCAERWCFQRFESESGGGIGRRKLTDRGNKGMVISHTGSNPVLTTKLNYCSLK